MEVLDIQGSSSSNGVLPMTRSKLGAGSYILRLTNEQMSLVRFEVRNTER